MISPTPSETPSKVSIPITRPERVLLAALVGAIVFQKGFGSGVQIELLVAAALALPLVLRQRLAPSGKSHLETVAFVLALLGILASAPIVTPLPGLWLSCGGLVCLAYAHPPEPRAWTSKLGWGVLALCCLEAGLLWWSKRPEIYHELRTLFLVPLVLESWRRRADPTAWSWRITVLAGALPLLDSLVWIKSASSATLAVALVACLASMAGLVSYELRNKATRRRALKVIFPLAFFGLCYFSAEVAFQVIPNRYRRIVVPNPDNQWHVPGGTYSYTGAIYFEEVGFENTVTWNKHGLWDVDHELDAAPLTSRVLVVGDSFVEGIQVSRDALLHSRLSKKLSEDGKKVEAIAYGWSGWGQTNSRIALLEGGELSDGTTYPPGLDYSPDVVVLEFLPGNDVYDNTPALKEEVSRQFLDSSSARRYYLAALGAKLYFSAMLLDKLDLAIRQAKGEQQSIVGDVYTADPPRFKELWQKGWEVTDQEIVTISAACRARGARLVVVVFPSFFELPTRDESSYPSQRLREICAARGVEFLDLTPSFSAESDHAGLYLGSDGHWSPRGHELAASAVADYLKGENKK